MAEGPSACEKSSHSGPIPQPYDDVETVAQNTEPPRAFWRPSANAAEAIAFDETNSLRTISLNGTWAFKLIEGKGNVPDCFHRLDFGTEDWDSIDVPSNWQKQGFGLPIYSNATLDIEPDEVGLYRRQFTLPADWLGRKTILRFDGVKTAFRVFLNGELIGYSEGRFLPTEFDVSGNLLPGENLLAVEVFRVADIQPMENFDTWRLSGIFRDVSVQSRPLLSIADIKATAQPVNAYRDGAWASTIMISNHHGLEVKGAVVTTKLIDLASGQTVAAAVTDPVSIQANAEHELQLETVVDGIRLWSAEAPHLYTAVYELSVQGAVQEAAAFKLGFRSVDIRNGKILVNGQKIHLKGVNRHEWSPLNARAITRAETEQELRLMKRLNINAIRTAHYPHASHLYELADELGFYVMGEAAMETHWVTRFERFGGAMLAHVTRMTDMIERDKNHPSVIFWSLGNEFYQGPNTNAMKAAAVALDPSRLIYNDGTKAPDGEIDFREQDRIRAAAYSSFEGLEKIASSDHRPVVMKEYYHAAGNTLGAFSEYWELIRSDEYPTLHGGFIWDFRDQGWPVEKDGVRYFDWGQDVGFSATGIDGIDGIVTTDLKVTPKALEVAKVFQDISVFVGADAQTYVIKNRHSFLSLSAFEGRYTVQVNGQGVYSQKLPGLNVPPGETGTIRLDIADLLEGLAPEADVRVLFEFFRRDEFVSPEDWPVWVQMTIREGSRPTRKRDGDKGDVKLTVLPRAFRIETEHAQLNLNSEFGRLISWRIDGAELIEGYMGPHLSFWRAPTDADRSAWGKVDDKYLRPWKAIGIDQLSFLLTDSQVITEISDKVVIDLEGCLRHSNECVSNVAYRYTFESDGEIIIGVNIASSEAMEQLPGLPRVGLNTHLRSSFEHISWMGRGPHENYRDRAASAAFGWYHSTVDDFGTDYIPLQTNANRSGVVHATLGDEAGLNIRVSRGDGTDQDLFPGGRSIAPPSTGAFEFSVSPYTQLELEHAEQAHELASGQKTVFNLDDEQAGVATHPRPTRLPQYEVHPGPRSFVFVFDPELSSHTDK